MEPKIVSTSVVITAEAHNPTILHPSFLRSEGIVPTEWQLAAEPPVSTPAISVVRFANNISMIVDPNKIQINDASGSDNPSIADVAIRYVNKLPHVHYTALGINIVAYAECSEPEKWLLHRFVKDGPWTRLESGIKAAGVRLVYDVDKSQLNLNVDVGTTQSLGIAEHECIVLNGNYHTAATREKAVEELGKALSCFRDRQAHFFALVNILLNQ